MCDRCTVGAGACKGLKLFYPQGNKDESDFTVVKAKLGVFSKIKMLFNAKEAVEAIESRDDWTVTAIILDRIGDRGKNSIPKHSCCDEGVMTIPKSGRHV